MLCQLPLTLPDVFYQAALINAPRRYVAIYYQRTKATWDAGDWGATFSYYALYRPLISHFVVSYYLAIAEADLGSDDTNATHCLLIDRKTNIVYLGSWRNVHLFVKDNQEKLKVKGFTLSEDEPVTRQGLFEFLGGAFGGGYSEKQQQETKELIEHLDSCVTEEIAKDFVNWAENAHSFAPMLIAKAFNSYYNRISQADNS
ncbi:hypothetical protein PCC7424_5508 (plasmid) [Gloeothece citriformis PCC 7424]|uniref:Uncharacterized protein n=1 Tax=Gloeothece citriformis (strain PCC 7424) TaxID=65393 RepID=B7KMQ5_GLOC7|nr:hypothetical protein [Gloeothece citriformis]ACK74077.1 hypothetical protein PCC7424_5508 [Gloeothece citriformis PCC 7424]